MSKIAEKPLPTIHPERRLNADDRFAAAYDLASRNGGTVAEAIREREFRERHGWSAELWSITRAAEFCGFRPERLRQLCKLGLGPNTAEPSLELFWFADLSRWSSLQPAPETKKANWKSDTPFRSPEFYRRCETLSSSASERIGARPGLFITVSLAMSQHVRDVQGFNKVLMQNAAERSQLIYNMVNEIVLGRRQFRNRAASIPGFVVAERLAQGGLRLEIPLHFHALFLFETEQLVEQAHAKLADKLDEKLSKAFGKKRFYKGLDDRMKYFHGGYNINSSKNLSTDIKPIQPDQMHEVSGYVTKYIYDTMELSFISLK